LPAFRPEIMSGTRSRAQAVCDYIAGMTDRYAVSRYEMYFLPRGLRLPDE